MEVPTISIVIPAYNESSVLAKTAESINTIMQEQKIHYEIVFVDDGSTDDTWQHIESLALTDTHIVGVKLSKNFGKEGAILAGLESAAGLACVLMDCDLQHPPHILIEMYELWKEGNVDVVEGIKQSRGKESFAYKHLSNLFYNLIERTGNMKLQNSSDFQLLDRRVVDIIIDLPERQRFFRALSSWVGFNRKQVMFSVNPRDSGVSKFTFFKSCRYALSNITSFSSAPMQIVTITGVIFFIASIAMCVHTFAMWAGGRAIEGFTTVILLLLFIGAMLMFSLGIIGYFIGKIYEEIKRRPPFLVDAIINKNGNIARGN